jgi:hypothetical protein
MDDWQVKLMAKLCLLVALMLTLDVAAITTDPRKTPQNSEIRLTYPAPTPEAAGG